MGTKIGKELSAELEIDPKRMVLHSDSLIAMFWLEKHQYNLTLMLQIGSEKYKTEISKCIIQAQIQIRLIF